MTVTRTGQVPALKPQQACGKSSVDDAHLPPEWLCATVAVLSYLLTVLQTAEFRGQGPDCILITLHSVEWLNGLFTASPSKYLNYMDGKKGICDSLLAVTYTIQTQKNNFNLRYTVSAIFNMLRYVMLAPPENAIITAHVHLCKVLIMNMWKMGRVNLISKVPSSFCTYVVFN